MPPRNKRNYRATGFMVAHLLPDGSHDSPYWWTFSTNIEGAVATFNARMGKPNEGDNAFFDSRTKYVVIAAKCETNGIATTQPVRPPKPPHAHQPTSPPSR